MLSLNSEDVEEEVKPGKEEREDRYGDDDKDGNDKDKEHEEEDGNDSKRKKRFHHGYSQRQNFVLMDNIIWAGVKHSNNAIELGIESHKHPYTMPNKKSFDILVKFLKHDITIVETFSCFLKHQISLKAMIKEASKN
ncbi:hypothetical protein ARMGADRAFT_1081117 [Armillaria gallica]|uniref:Uncharacterized protein n=1 Tax=Armillaria gallica TaxID=47427 RepID=A0A2H3DDY4_ARMGA|nr:hypothetical protein ARMGADRAFT_1081117 [Armillaria gallica]